MTLDMGNTDKLSMFASEARKSGIAMRPPSVNVSGVDFGAEPPVGDAKSGAIRYSLAALKNIGAGAVETIVNEREANGPFALARRFCKPRRCQGTEQARHRNACQRRRLR